MTLKQTIEARIEVEAILEKAPLYAGHSACDENVEGEIEAADSFRLIRMKGV